MKVNDSILSGTEELIYSLRALYNKYGYSSYKMSKFEEYDLYARNKDYLISDSVITFTDTNGKLMALKPDVTLSIIKNIEDVPGEIRKFCYNENVYRVSKSTNSFREIMQTGLECIGAVDEKSIGEVLYLAMQSLKACSDSFVLDVSDLDILSAFLDKITDSNHIRKEILKCIGEKNAHGITEICVNNGIDAELALPLISLISLYGKPADVFGKLEKMPGVSDISNEIKSLKSKLAVFDSTEFEDKINLDFSVVDNFKYYNGVVFKGFVEGIPESVLSGGQYDKLMKEMKRKSKACGFAVYIDKLDRLINSKNSECNDECRNSSDNNEAEKMLNVALPKGRLGERVYSIFEQAGFECPSIKENSRKLIFENKETKVRYFWVKPSDVAIYVEKGAADIGVAGKDILLEYEPEVYELADLKTGICRMAVAAPVEFKDDTSSTLRVATKFSKIATDYYSSKGRDIDIIHLNGSIEIAPILGLSDVIVDIVETGTTLKENNLEVKETVVPISARLIANKSSFKFKNEQIEKIVRKVSELSEEAK